MKCLDTTFLVDLLRNERGAVEKSKELDEIGFHATTSINAFEVLYGVYRSKLADRTRVLQVQRLLGRLLVLPLNYQAALKAGEILGGLAKRGKEISAFDGLVACIALAHGCKIIVTRNARDFEEIPGIEVETY